MAEYRIDDDGTIIEVIDPTGEDCGCVITRHPGGAWFDSGCFRHLPHDWLEADDDD